MSQPLGAYIWASGKGLKGPCDLVGTHWPQEAENQRDSSPSHHGFPCGARAPRQALWRPCGDWQCHGPGPRPRSLPQPPTVVTRWTLSRRPDGTFEVRWGHLGCSCSCPLVQRDLLRSPGAFVSWTKTLSWPSCLHRTLGTSVGQGKEHRHPGGAPRPNQGSSGWCQPLRQGCRPRSEPIVGMTGAEMATPAPAPSVQQKDLAEPPALGRLCCEAPSSLLRAIRPRGSS